MNVRSVVTLRLPIVLYCIVGLGLIVQGARYLGGTEIAPYHLAVIDASWIDIDDRYRRLLLGLYRGFGAGFICVGLSIIVLATIPARRGDRWALWATPAIAGIYTAALVYVTSSALLARAVPTTVSAMLFAAVTLAALLSHFRKNT